MSMLSRIITLFFLLFHITGNAQTDIQRDRRVDPVLKQVAVKRPGLHMYSRKDGKDGYINMAVLDDSTRQLKWFTCHGAVFDAVQLRDDEYSQLATGRLDPFTFYRNYCYESLYYIEQAELLYRLQGKKALENTTHNNRIIFNTPAVKSAETTLQKLMAIERLMKGICLRLRVFDSRSPRLLIKYRNDSSRTRTRRKLAGTMIRSADSTEYYNTDPMAGASRIVLRRQSSDRLFVYDQEGALMDSVPLKPGKYAALLQEKEDVFLLYRGWLELQWQQAVDNRQQYIGSLRKLDSSLYRPASWAAGRHQIRNALVGLQEQQSAVSDKISSLIVPESKYAEQLIADAYRDETSEISYLPGLGFAYSVSFIRGQKVYELTDHRGNVMAVVSDKKKSVDENADGVIDYYNADVVSANDYYPFGMQQPGRNYSAAGEKYRYGYNGKENDNEVKGDGNQQDYGMRIYDTRIAKFLSVDPLTPKYPGLTPYQFAGNSPIAGVDIDGLENFYTNSANAQYIANLVRPKSEQLTHTQINELYKGEVEAKRQGAPLILSTYVGGFGLVNPAWGIPLTLSILTGAPVTPSPQALEGMAASNATRAAIETEEAIPQGAVAVQPPTPGSTGGNFQRPPSAKVSAANANLQAAAANGENVSAEVLPVMRMEELQDGIVRGAVSYGAKGEVEFLANKVITNGGQKIEYTDILFYPKGSTGNEMKNIFGVRAMDKTIELMKQQAKSDGFKQLRIQYQRAANSSSAKPGKIFDETFDLE